MKVFLVFIAWTWESCSCL